MVFFITFICSWRVMKVFCLRVLWEGLPSNQPCRYKSIKLWLHTPKIDLFIAQSESTWTSRCCLSHVQHALPFSQTGQKSDTIKASLMLCCDILAKATPATSINIRDMSRWVSRSAQHILSNRRLFAKRLWHVRTPAVLKIHQLMFPRNRNNRERRHNSD